MRAGDSYEFGGPQWRGVHAGFGAAWLWQGGPEEDLSADVLAAVRRFVRPFGRSMRAVGGARFDSTAAPAAEWAAFGGYCMLLPGVELVGPPRLSCM